MMRQTVWCVSAFLAAYVLVALGSPSSNSTVILVSFDGFRWDYMTKAETPNFDFIAKTGVKAPYVKNVFPTVTIPNYYTIVTGLLPESHGLIANEMFDPEWKAIFDRNNNESRWWDGGEPVWVSNQKQGFKSGVCFWPGFDVVIRGYFPSYSSNGTGFSKPFRSGGKFMPTKERIDMIMKWLSGDQPPTFVAVYFEEPDLTGHKFGPDSSQVKAMISEQDQEVMGYFLDKLRETKLLDQVNLIITSDHGMTASNASNFVDFDTILNASTYDVWAGNEAFWTIQPRPGNESYVYDTLKEAERRTQLFKVFKKEEVPESLHFKHNKRIGSIVGLMKEGWSARSSKVPGSSNSTMRGIHGYNNSLEDMHSFFLARGPAFKENFITEAFELTDIYLLICSILGINPAPNNGSLERVKQLLRDDPPLVRGKQRNRSNIVRIAFIAVLGVVALVCGVAVVLLTVKYCKRRQKQSAWSAREETEGLTPAEPEATTV